jgi:pimeloyl-ACP methyl ester carboxylesterase
MGQGPYQLLGALARQEVRVSPTLRHVEVFTMQGLLTLLWHGDPAAEHVVVMCGGAMGGLLGPAGGLFHDLGERLATEHGIATIRVSYRRPNDLDMSTLDALAAADLAARTGGQRFVTVGHSFGGAIAVRAAIAMGEWAAGVVTLATQSAGCEDAEALGDTPLLLLHGDRDEILPMMASQVVHHLAGGHGELIVLEGTGHLMTESHDELRDRLTEWIPARFT